MKFLSSHLWQISTIFFATITIILSILWAKRELFIARYKIGLEQGRWNFLFTPNEDKKLKQLSFRNYVLNKQNNRLRSETKYLPYVIVLIMVMLVISASSLKSKKKNSLTNVEQ
jgi:hypothetical protein